MSITPAQHVGGPRRLTLPPDLSRVADVRQWVAEVAKGLVSESRLFDIQVSVSEAAANAIEHASSEVGLAAWVLPDRLVVEITNDGVFQPGLYKDHAGRRRGLGLPLMVSLADQVHVSRLESGKTQVSLTFFLDGYRQPVPELAPLVLHPESAVQKAERLPGRSVALLLVPIPLLIISVALIYALGVSGAWDSATLLTAGNTLFLSAASIVIAYLAASSYRLTRSYAVLALGAAALVFGIGFLVSGPLISDRNDSVTFHNTSVLIAGLLFALSGFLTWRQRDSKSRGVPERLLALAYVAGFAFMILLTILTLTATLPRFFVPDQGYTVVREVVLGLGVVALLASSVFFGLVYRRQPTRFVLLCALGLGVVAVSLGALLLTQASSGSPIVWISRAGQWLGGIYLVMAVLTIERAGAAILPLERSLREVEDRYKNLVDLSPDAILVTIEGKQVFVNPAAARLFGMSGPADLVGKDPLQFIHIDDREAVKRRLGEVVAGATLPSSDIRILKVDGSIIPVEATASRVEFGGRLANQVVLRDISERKNAEEALRESEERFRTMVEAIPQLAWIASADGYIYWYNRQWYEYTGTTIEQMEGWGWQSVHDPDVLPAVLARWRASIATGKPFDMEFPLRGADGEYRLFLTRVTPQKDASGHVMEWFGTSTDISERGRTEEALRAAEGRYRQLAEENERLYRQQLDIAENLQAAFLHIPSELGSVRLGHLYRSATEAARIGGDFYDVFDVKENKIALLIGDVAGHGIRAARTATLVKDVVHAFIHQRLLPHEVLRRTNTLLIEKELSGYVTLFLGILDTKTGELRYSSAGHPDMLLRRASHAIEHLGAGSAPLGIYADSEWKPSAVELQADDFVVLFTDGVIEARRDGELYGEKRLETLIGSELIPAEDLPQVILDQVLAFSGGMLQDDLAILTLRLVTKGEALRSNQ